MSGEVQATSKLSKQNEFYSINKFPETHGQKSLNAQLFKHHPKDCFHWQMLPYLSRGADFVDLVPCPLRERKHVLTFLKGCPEHLADFVSLLKLRFQCRKQKIAVILYV